MDAPAIPDIDFFKLLSRSGAVNVKQLESVEGMFNMYKGGDGSISKRHALCLFRNLGIRIEVHPEGEGSLKERVTLEELLLLLVQLIRREQASFGEEFEDDALYHEDAKLERLFRMVAWISGKAPEEKDDRVLEEDLALFLRWQGCSDVDSEGVNDFLFQLVGLQRYYSSIDDPVPAVKEEFIENFRSRHSTS